MSVQNIAEIGIGLGSPVVPSLDDYNWVSDTWAETEYRVLDDHRAVVAAWSGDVGSARIDCWPYDEICVLLSGRVRLEDAEGGSRHFKSGQAFLIPAGFSGWWHTEEPSHKVFVAIHPVNVDPSTTETEERS